MLCESRSPLVSVCMPMYNASEYLRECIDSVLAQSFEDFEFLIVDDGSTDDSVSIVRSYADPRIRLIQNNHDYIGSLNILLDEARGKYIARMDADDVMMPYRLMAQFGYLEKHKNVGVLGGGMQQIGKLHGVVIPSRIVTVYEMINSCSIAHPSVMIRASIFKEHGFRYEEEFKFAEDYRLWMQMFKYGIVFHNLPTPIIKYRISDTQITSIHSEKQLEKTYVIKKDGANWVLGKIKKTSYEDVYIPQSHNLLTIVIPFLNEKDEVGKTVRSIRNTAGNNVDIIVINDHSDDGYDYRADLVNFNVIYIQNDCRIGAAASKEKGARLVCTPYFLLLDAHMRCFTQDWHNIIIAELKKNERRILCCQTKPLEKRADQVIYEKKVATTNGAYVTFDYNDYIPGIQWDEFMRQDRLPDNQIACVLGAGYAASKRYWRLIRGLEGLMHYGSEETYLSMKAWLEGGGCCLLPNVVFGHIYRAVPPYKIITAQMHYNLFVISTTLFPTSLQCWSNAIAYKKDKAIYQDIKFWLSMQKDSLERLREYYSQTFHADFEGVLNINNIADGKKSVMANYERKRIPSLLNYLVECSETSQIDLWEGCMGVLIVLCEYEKYMQSAEYALLAGKILERITSRIIPDAEIPVSFAHGICGIGWGLIYLMRNKLAEIDFSQELQIIDKMVMERDPERITDFSFQRGIGGILCYVANRLYILQERQTAVPFDSKYLTKLNCVAKSALRKSNDFRTHSYALLFLEYGKADWCVLCPKWKDILELPNFLPQDPQKWKDGLIGALGYMCNIIHTLRYSMQDIGCTAKY